MPCPKRKFGQSNRPVYPNLWLNVQASVAATALEAATAVSRFFSVFQEVDVQKGRLSNNGLSKQFQKPG